MSWYFVKEQGKVFIEINGRRINNSKGEGYGPIQEIDYGKSSDEVQVRINFCKKC